MQPLKTYHGPSHSLFIEIVIVGMALFQQQYQSLCPAMGFSLWVSGVNLGACDHCNVDQLVNPDHHPAHFKGVVVFWKSAIPLCLNVHMVVPTWPASCCYPFHLSLRPEAAFAEPTGSSHPFPGLLLGGAYGHFVCVRTCDVVSRSCVHIRVDRVLPGKVWFRWDLITSTPQTSYHSTIIRISGDSRLDWKGLVGSCSCCCLKLGPASGTNFGMSSSPCAEICSLLALTSWELTWDFFSWWSLTRLLEKQSHTLCAGMVNNWQMGIPLGKCLQRGCLVMEVLEVVEFQVDEQDCLRGLDPVSSQAWIQLGCPCPVAQLWPAFHSCSGGELRRRHTKAVTW